MKREKAEEALKKSESRYRQLFEHTSNGVAIYEAVDNGRDFIFVGFNSAAERIDNISASQVLGKKLTEAFPGVEEFGLFAVLQRVWRTGTPEFFPSTRYADSRIAGWRENYVYKLPEGSVVAIYTDITERKRMEEALEGKVIELEQTHAALQQELDVRNSFLDALPFVALVLKKGTREIIFANAAGRQIGADLGTTCYRACAGTDHPCSFCLAPKMLESGIPQRFDRILHKGRYYTGIWAPYDADSYFHLIIDTTDEILSEMQLQQSEKKYRLLFETSLEGILIADYETKTIVYSNPAASALFGYSAEEFLGMEVSRFHPPESLDQTMAGFEAQARGEARLLPDEPCLKKDGSTFFASINGAPIIIDGKKCMAGFFTDITERKFAEIALEESRDYLEKLTDTILDTVFMVKMPERTIEYMNDSYDIIGYEPAECIGRTTEFLYADSNEFLDFGSKLSIALEEGRESVRAEQLLKRRDGRIFPAEITATIFRDSGGSVVSTTSIVRDISDRRQVEEALRENREDLALAQSIAHIGNWKYTLATGELHWSDEMFRIYGLDPEETGASLDCGIGMIHPEDRAFAENTFANAQNAGIPYQIEYRIIRPDGEMRYLQGIGKIEKDEQGNVLSVYGTGQDITDLKRTEEEILKRNRELLALNEAAGIISQSHDHPEALMAVIDLLLRVTGMQGGGIALENEDGELRTEAVRVIPGLIAPPDTEWDLGQGLIGLVCQTGEGIYIDNIGNDPRARMETRQATSLGVKSFYGTPIRGKEKLIGVLFLASREEGSSQSLDTHLLETIASQLAMSIENTELIRQSAELEALREVDRLRSELLSTVSHELRTPLAAIKGYASMITEYGKQLPEEEKEQYIEAINRSSDRLTNLIDQLLDMSRLESGMLKIELNPADITGLLETVAVDARMRKPDHDIELEVEDVLPPATIDSMRIRQVMDNLIDNAAKYSPVGTRITLSACCRGDSHLEIRVKDEGIGISPDDLPKVFDRMYRGHHIVDGVNVGGVGLGLSICKGLVEAHGGRIWIESKLGRGTTCRFTLPLSEVNPTT